MAHRLILKIFRICRINWNKIFNFFFFTAGIKNRFSFNFLSSNLIYKGRWRPLRTREHDVQEKNTLSCSKLSVKSFRKSVTNENDFVFNYVRPNYNYYCYYYSTPPSLLGKLARTQCERLAMFGFRINATFVSLNFARQVSSEELELFRKIEKLRCIGESRIFCACPIATMKSSW